MHSSRGPVKWFAIAICVRFIGWSFYLCTHISASVVVCLARLHRTHTQAHKKQNAGTYRWQSSVDVSNNDRSTHMAEKYVIDANNAECRVRVLFIVFKPNAHTIYVVRRAYFAILLKHHRKRVNSIFFFSQCVLWFNSFRTDATHFPLPHH